MKNAVSSVRNRKRLAVLRDHTKRCYFWIYKDSRELAFSTVLWEETHLTIAVKETTPNVNFEQMYHLRNNEI